MADLVSDIVGRVNRLPLKPSETNALLPLMEAFSNALHAVNLRFGDDAASKGRIQITILRDSSDVIGFKIEDNGIGFTDENYRSFRTPVSSPKNREALGGEAEHLSPANESAINERRRAGRPVPRRACHGPGGENVGDHREGFQQVGRKNESRVALRSRKYSH
jgi:hypothetical protein